MPLIATNPKPRVILGLMTFGPDVSEGARITSLAEYNEFLDHFQAAGYNEIDTARTYVGGKQEGFTRDAKWKDRGLTIATKCWPSFPGAHSPEALTKSFNISLKELGTDSVDIFYLHAPDHSIPFTDTLAAIDKLHKEGKFVQFALSNFAAFEVAEIALTCHHNNWVRPTLYQGMYNAITRSLEQELIPACKRYGLDVVVYNPIAAGIFSGKYKSKDMVPDEGRYSNVSGVIGARYRERYFKDSVFEALKIIEPVVEKHGLTMVETALRWVVNHSALNIKDGNDGVIIGCSSLAQLDENLKDCEKGPLPADVIEALDKAWQVSKADTPDYFRFDFKYGYDTRKALYGK